MTFLSVDHKPNDYIERTRIENAGGVVKYDRVDGDLAVSRAFGDFQWKRRSDLKPTEQRVTLQFIYFWWICLYYFYLMVQVTCFPDIMVHQRNSTDEVLLLACDGVWDVFSNEEVASLIYEILDSGETSMTFLAEEIADMALDKGRLHI